MKKLLVLPFIVVSLFLFTQNVSAASNIPGTSLVVNGSVSAIVTTSSTTYVGGFFGSVGNNTLDLAQITTSNGVSSASFPVTNGQIFTIISDGNGGWYVGGNFTLIGGVARNYLAHVKSDTTIDSSFNPNMNSQVIALALSSDGSTLYAGGNFTTANGGTTRNFLASFTTSNGIVVSAFNPNMSATVSALALSPDGSTLYAGGAFNGANSVNGSTTRNYLASFTTSNGTVVSAFNPNTNNQVQALTLSPDGSILYAGGSFTTVNGGTTANRLTAFTTSNGAIVSAFNPNMNNAVWALTLSSDGTTLYAGGAFNGANSVNGSTTRNYLASVTTSNGTVVSTFNPNMGNSVSALALSSDGSTLYTGGAFSTVNGSTTRNYLASFTTSNGTVTSLDPEMNNNVSALALSSDNSTLYAGGLFSLSNVVTRNNLVAFSNSDGTLVGSFNPNMNNQVQTLALSSDGTTLYAGGSFTTVNGGTTANRLASFTTSNGAMVSAFNPNMNGTVSTLVLSSDGTTLYAGGSFTTVNGGTTANRLASFTTSNGAMVSAFNPNMSASVNTLALSSDGSTIYAGGTFNGSNSVNGSITRNFLAAFTTSNGTVVSGFNPNMDGYVLALALSSDGSTLYAGGQFTTVNGGTTRNNIAAVTTSNGTVTSFNPNMNNQVQTLALSSDDSILYAGGAFTTVNGSTTRNRVASFATSNGTVTNFNPNINSTVNALVLSSNNGTLYAGGSFTTANGYSRIKYAVFNVLQPSNQNAVFPSSVIKQSGATTPIISSGDTSNQIWFAPASTSSFSAGPTITQAGSGVSTTIIAPAADGVYYLYVLDAIGDISPASIATLTVDSVPPSTPTASPDTGTYANTQSVSLSASGSNTIQYSTASTPADCTSGTSYTTPISVSLSETIYVRACDLALNSSTASFAYTIVPNTVVHNGGHPIPISFDPNSVVVSQPIVVQPTQATRVAPKALQSPTVLPILNVVKNLTIGATTADVKTLQQFLIQQNTGPNARALATHSTTSYFGPLTKKALAEWQHAHNLPATGYFGQLTRMKILEMENS